MSENEHNSGGKRVRRSKNKRALVLAVLGVILVLILAGIIFWMSWARLPDLSTPPPSSSGDRSDTSQEDSDLPKLTEAGRKDGVYTFLVAGQDVASGGTDTIILLTYDVNAKEIRGMNIPRDTMVNTTAIAKRVNAVYGRNKGSRDLPEAERVALGMAVLKEEVAKISGITADYFVLVEWKAIGELVDALGGVEFEVPFDMHYEDPFQDLYIHQEAGLRLLDGDDAMEVIRFRKNNSGSVSLGDVGRLEIQQDFLKAVAKKCLQPATFLKIPDLAAVFTENVTTDLTVGNIVALAQAALGMDPETGVTFQTPTLAASFLYKTAALVTLKEQSILDIVNDGMNPYLRDIEGSDLDLVFRKGDGSFRMTTGELLDPEMAKVPPPPAPEPEPEPVPEPPVEGSDVVDGTDTGDGSQIGNSAQTGDNSQTGDTSQGGDVSDTGEPSDTGDTSQPELGNPDPVLPDPEEVPTTPTEELPAVEPEEPPESTDSLPVPQAA